MKRDHVQVVVVYLIAGMAAFLGGWLAVGLHPLLTVLAADLVGTVVVFGFSRYYDNSSLYDPYWSVAPALIAGYWLAAGNPLVVGNVRQGVILVLVLTWSIRLTLNWAFRWRGMGHEDWRYIDLRGEHGQAYWLVSFFGIHLMPTILVFLGCLPLIPSSTVSGVGFGMLDLIATGVTVCAIWMEARADLEVTRFVRAVSEETALLQRGLWSFSRHPNYLGEILFWWGLYLFGLAASPGYWWTIIGPLMITLLFLFISIPMIEKRMLARKPGYSRYQQTTPMLVPWLGFRKTPTNQGGEQERD
jgi:steroid 5-alpha reductase family enzyme